MGAESFLGPDNRMSLLSLHSFRVSSYPSFSRPLHPPAPLAPRPPPKTTFLTNVYNSAHLSHVIFPQALISRLLKLRLASSLSSARFPLLTLRLTFGISPP